MVDCGRRHIVDTRAPHQQRGPKLAFQKKGHSRRSLVHHSKAFSSVHTRCATSTYILLVAQIVSMLYTQSANTTQGDKRHHLHQWATSFARAKLQGAVWLLHVVSSK